MARYTHSPSGSISGSISGSTRSLSATPPPAHDPLFFTYLIDKRFGLDRTKDGPMDELQAWAMNYNKQLNPQQIQSTQQYDQIAALQGMTSGLFAAPQDPQLIRNVGQAEQLLAASTLPTGAQVLGAEILHAQGWSREAVANQVQYQLPDQVAAESAPRLALRPKTRAQARLKARSKVTPSSSTLSLSIRPKHPPTLTNDQIRQLVEFIESNPNARRTPMADIPSVLGFDCSEQTIITALGRKGFKSSPAITRPRIDEKTRQMRLHFAQSYCHWTAEQWESVVFYAEMRVPLKEQPQQVFVTRKSDEDVHPDCINFEPVAPPDYTNSNVYFAYLSGVAGLGRLPSWNRHSSRVHGSLSPESWYLNIFPSLVDFLQDHSGGPRFALSPDLPAHCNVTIRDELRSGHKPVLYMPPTSPDLNPITEIFGTMMANLKVDKANSLFGDVTDYRIDDVVRDTWQSISKEYLSELIGSMPERCQAVIDADGWYTRY
ncbi:unnamed protein product [Fusarium graminearum]|uniref:Chromosome 2, complete genome n=2 Tax=Gibberella zeae TaxID=5518 RepID=I1RX05_GIBZE|nr:hypothetical protein FGSG_08846 [Fusarium graminearum PH-1]PCD33853.1 hypothetical protein FGRA07_09008 [Fusarium graminearum]ESU14441.1 hypothetical protein FGSG_08846 [Fusarium graminearum PH-1]CAF3431998.1 unnamed protein product [Fusarium graminearum]CAG1974836.1 unnamed protein product [Fusarium graminearum]CAG2001087.1 unnamed protein product [Fusarium graminearum]|eukprot:XP_011319866.1 hypothetical protein FGSG_08846 [Fusarium graminearum PH-1]